MRIGIFLLKNEQIKASHTGKGIGRKLFHML
jgi:hypothetical protein